MLEERKKTSECRIALEVTRERARERASTYEWSYNQSYGQKEMNLKIKRILGESVAAGGKTVMRESGKGWSTGEATTATAREAERANERNATWR